MSNEGKVKPSIGFLGLGEMGKLMALRLLKADYPLTVYNRTRQKTEPFAVQGSTAETPQELAVRC